MFLENSYDVFCLLASFSTSTYPIVFIIIIIFLL